MLYIFYILETDGTREYTEHINDDDDDTDDQDYSVCAEPESYSECANNSGNI